MVTDLSFYDCIPGVRQLEVDQPWLVESNLVSCLSLVAFRLLPQVLCFTCRLQAKPNHCVPWLEMLKYNFVELANNFGLPLDLFTFRLMSEKTYEECMVWVQEAKNLFPGHAHQLAWLNNKQQDRLF